MFALWKRKFNRDLPPKITGGKSYEIRRDYNWKRHPHEEPCSKLKEKKNTFPFHNKSVGWLYSHVNVLIFTSTEIYNLRKTPHVTDATQLKQIVMTTVGRYQERSQNQSKYNKHIHK